MSMLIEGTPDDAAKIRRNASAAIGLMDMAKEPIQPPEREPPKPSKPPAEEPGKPYPVENPPAPAPNEDRPLVDPVPPDGDKPRM